MSDSHTRSILKAISWRILGTLATMLVVYCFTREWGTSFYIGALEMSSKIFLFYCHERLWLKFKQ